VGWWEGRLLTNLGFWVRFARIELSSYGCTSPIVEWEGSKLDAKESVFTKLLCFPTSRINQDF
jgi:hypothetical protein